MFHHSVLLFFHPGEEFDAVFLSTAEPTNAHGEPPNPSKSICNDYVFNTVLTRARSLVYSIGNPFLLQHKGSSQHFSVNCWQEYIQRCIQCQTLVLPEVNSEEETRSMPHLVEQLSSRVYLAETLEQATTTTFDDQDLDDIVEQYINDLQKRREYRISHKLVQDPRGEISWNEVQEDSQQQEGDEAIPEGGVVWCTLDCKSHRLAHAIPKDPSQPTIKIDSLHARRLAFHGDEVKVDVVRQCVLLDNETEEAICKTHFGTSFLCRVNQQNPIMFFPIDKRHPKFVNLPSLTRNEKEGVVCFDPKSINSSPKVSNFIPIECAVNMLFIVKFLGWRKKYSYPLGIIVGALPRGHSVSTGDMVLRISNGIPLTPPEFPPSHPALHSPVRGGLVFSDAFTIDPAGSPDHDDALTCRFIRKTTDGLNEYEIGVHITNLSKHVPKGSSVDEMAFQRGCSVYRSPDKCISAMLPSEVIARANVTKGKLTDTFSVLVPVFVNQDSTTVERVGTCSIRESQVVSALELTYQEAQSIIFSQMKNQGLRTRLLRYDQAQLPSTPPLSIKTKLKILWNVAFFLRQNRLGPGASSFLISDPDKEVCPEAHILIEEFMVWANQQVAKMLLRYFPKSTILRKQGRPNAEQLEALVKHSGSIMALSPGLNCYLADSVVPSSIVHLLRDTVKQIQQCIQSDVTGIVAALHCIQNEHLHPQLATAYDNFRRKAQSSAEYCVSNAQQQDYWHDTLKCAEYTHFTSPIRRYIDIVIQRFLHAALHGEQQSPPHTRSELDQIIVHVKGCLRKGNAYEREVKKLCLAHELLSSSYQLLCFVMEVREGKMYFKFRDLSLKFFHTEDFPVHLKNLNALDISFQKKPASAAMPGKHNQQSENPPIQMFTWRVKITSFTGKPQTFLGHPQLLYTSRPCSDRRADVVLFIPDGDGELKMADWKQETLIQADIQPFTCPVPLSEWQGLQSCLKLNPTNPDTRAASHALQNLCKSISIPDSQMHPPTGVSNAFCPVWIYKVQRPIHPCEVMEVQLSATCDKSIISPCIQLLEVGPNLSICVQHNANPAECFTDKPTENASKKEYQDVTEYFRRWEQVLLAEGAFSSLVDAEFLLIKDVELKWPPLTPQVSSDGQLFYQLPMAKGTLKDGVQLQLSTQFEEASLSFFSFSEGDLLCIRYENTDKATRGDLRYVFHMVVSHIRYNPKPITVYLKFVGKSSNYIPVTMEKALRNPSLLRCEIQLVHLSLPFRYV